MDVSVVIVSYNTRRLVEACLLSVERHLEGRLDYEVIVVDNDSRDGTPGWLDDFAKERPRLQVRHAGANLGFSGGNNVGIRLARGRHVLLLNSDAYLIDDSLIPALAYLDAHPDVFSLAGLLYLADGRSPGPSYGHFPTAGTLARELLGRRFGALRAVCPAPDEPTHDIDFPCGAYYLMNGRMLKELEGMDEGFFVYFEETDLAKRARDRGYRNVYFAPAKAVHLGGQSTNSAPTRLTAMFYGNWRRYLRKHHGPLEAALVRGMLGGYFTSAGLYHALLGHGREVTHYRAHRQALADGWAGQVRGK